VVKATHSRDEAVDQLRDQALSCRRLARSSRTAIGSTALLTVAGQFEADAFRIERLDRDEFDSHESAQGRLRAALARQSSLWPRAVATRSANEFSIGDRLDG